MGQGDVQRQRHRTSNREGDEACGDGCVVGGGRFQPKLTYQAVNRSCVDANNTCSHESNYQKKGKKSLTLLSYLLALIVQRP